PFGTFTQTGRAVNVTGTMQVSRNNGSAGIYNLNAGIVSVTGDLLVGYGNGQTSGLGTLVQASGTSISVTGNMNTGGNGSSTLSTTNAGVYNINGGQTTLSAAGAIWGIGNGLGSQGTVTQAGGTVNQSGATSVMDIGRNGGSGVYNLNGGVLNVNKVSISSTNTGGTRTFNVGGGTLNATAVDFGSTAPPATRSFNISSGTANVTNFTLANSGVLSISGGTPNITNLTLGSTASKLQTSVNL